MIKSLHIKNFQSHKDTKFEFSNNVNIMVGDSDRGKSSVIRALRLLCENRPRNAEWFPNFAGNKGKTEIIAEFDDCNIKLQKYVSKGKNSKKTRLAKYFVNKNMYEAFGFDVPDHVSEKICFYPVNWQWQHEYGFLVLDTPGNIGKYINEIIDINKIDQWIYELGREINEDRREYNRLDAKTKNLERELGFYPDIDDLRKKIKKIKLHSKRIEKYEKFFILLSDLKKKKEEYKRKSDVCEYISEKMFEIDNNRKKIIFYEKSMRREKLLNDLTKRKYTCNIVLDLKDRIEKNKKTIVLFSSYLHTKEEFDKLEETINELSVEYKRRLIEIGKCPLCQSYINEDMIERIL